MPPSLLNLNMSDASCIACDGAITCAEEAFKCKLCSQFFHPVCANVREEKFRKLPKDKKENWKCVKCLNSKSLSESADKIKQSKDSSQNTVSSDIKKLRKVK